MQKGGVFLLYFTFHVLRINKWKKNSKKGVSYSKVASKLYSFYKIKKKKKITLKSMKNTVFLLL